MTTITGSRLPSVPSLSTILPTGTEGGKEFGRIVGLLLFNDAKRSGLEFNLFDDASGDYEGLDSYSRIAKSKDVIGYQYKFFTAPLSNSHRQQIRISIEHALQRSERLKLIKWVLVTPDDFKNSGRREGGGDVEWFEELQEIYKEKVILEHMGHTKLLSLFLQTPYLCLFYYPTLVKSGEVRRKSIQELRTQYDENMRKRYDRIEFVGMSVYKEEASRRIPLEDIYIPLSVVSERAPDENDDTPRVNPTTFLVPGARTVILGDPGSGKSTLLAFLALVGTSKTLQTRCGVSEDNRLTIVVTLRRYADELKSRKNLPLLDYILEVAKADFNMGMIDKSFYEYYLESGQSIILFDGLDELPGSGFKTIIRQRIESFNINYPLNTLIVTSRLVGYEAEIRFDKTYGHFRVSKLRINEIERFISDWYSARIDDQVEKKRNASDLIRVITHPDSESIRGLARNPLLLTIVALVHRVDAVLPDQRVVLYQKCTETLLNTWYKAKRRDEEIVKGRVERRNRLRIEEIAYWMHKKSLAEQGRSVAPREDLLAFLTAYISKNEKIKDSDEPAEDQAEIFLEFIKNSAGLLIEAGDGLYSFIHLTFQEYLCATHLAAFGEMGGAQSIWDELAGDLQNPRWREVVRLLVASLRSIPGQTFFIDKLVDEHASSNPRDTVLLLIGLLRDAIEPAEERANDIVRQAMETLQGLTDPADIRLIESALLSWVSKDASNSKLSTQVWDEVFVLAEPQSRLILTLIRAALGLPQLSDNQKQSLTTQCDAVQLGPLRTLIFDPPENASTNNLSLRLDCLDTSWALHNPETNAAAVLGLCTSILLDPIHIPRRLLCRELALLSVYGDGPHHDHGLNLVALALPNSDMHSALRNALHNALSEKDVPMRHHSEKNLHEIVWSLHESGDIPSKAKEKSRGEFQERRGEFEEVIENEFQRRAKRFGISNSLIKVKRMSEEQNETSELNLIRQSFKEKAATTPESYWHMLQSSEIFSLYLIDSLEACIGIIPKGHWREALGSTLKSRLPHAISKYFDQREWRLLDDRLNSQKVDDDDIDFAAWLILFDIWIWKRSGYETADRSPLAYLVTTAQTLGHPLLRFALSVRATCQGVQGAEKVLLGVISERNAFVVDLLTMAGWPRLGEVLLSASPKPKRTASKPKK
jgi:energy-coupling factor transporter ATP-binding protein EcfA2